MPEQQRRSNPVTLGLVLAAFTTRPAFSDQ